MNQTAAACCAEMYEKDWVQELLGDSLHPGGLELSRRLWKKLPLGQPSVRILDVACGTGTTAIALAKEHGAHVIAVDFGEANLAKGVARAEAEGVSELIEWVHADARDIPLEDGVVDGVVCECAVSTFQDKRAVIAEFDRVVRQGGVVVISDMVVTGELPQDLAGVLAPWTCVGDALDVIGYQRLFLDQGLRAICSADETYALSELLLDLKRKLVVAAMGGVTVGLKDMGLSVADARDLLARSREVVDAGTVQYARMCFSKGVPTVAAAPEVESGSCCSPSSGCC